MKVDWDDAPANATHWCSVKQEWRDENEESISDCCVRIPSFESEEDDLQSLMDEIESMSTKRQANEIFTWMKENGYKKDGQ